MMLAYELVNELKSFSCSEGLEIVERAPIINKVNPYTFNFSLEEPVLRKFGSLLSITEPWAFSTIQPCIRTTDLALLRKKIDTQWHLSMFHIGAVDFQLSPEPHKINELHSAALKRLFHFLVDRIGLDPNRFLVTYFGGGWINEISNGKFPLRKYFGPDEITRQTFIELGLAPKQIQAKSNLDTFLLTFPLPIDFWAGYRFELFYYIRNSLVEIATGEAIRHKRIWREGKVVDIVDMDGCAVPVVIGIERTLAARNELNSLFECDHISPLFKTAWNESKNSSLNDEEKEIIVKALVDSIRALHIIVADGGKWSELNPELKEELNTFLRTIYDSINHLSISPESLFQLFKYNAVLQPWLNNLDSACESALHEFIDYCKRRER